MDKNLFKTIHRVYDEIVRWRKNFFKFPSGNAAKMFIREPISWLKLYNCELEDKSITEGIHDATISSSQKAN